MTEDERDEIIKTALAKEYKDIWEWEPTPIDQPYGADDREKVAQFAEHVRVMREACVAALRELPDNELIKIRDFQPKPMEISTWPWSKLLPDHHHPANLWDRIPPKWAYGFGHPAFRPDFRYWAMMPDLGLLEATLLSVGADPKSMSSEDLYGLKKKKPEKLWSSLKFLIERYDLLFRVFPSGFSGKGSMRTAHFYEWTKEVELEIHPEFLKALSRRFDKLEGSMLKAEATPTEKLSLLKMIAAMAIEQYGYNPSAHKNDAVKNLCDDLDGLGIGLDPKTLRKWLKEACALIEPDNLPK